MPIKASERTALQRTDVNRPTAPRQTAPGQTAARPTVFGTIIGLLLIATFVAAAGLWLREYTNDRRQAWLLNSSSDTVVVFIGNDPHTLLGHEAVSVSVPREAAFELRLERASRVYTETVTRTPDRQEALVIDLSPAAIYVVVDMTPRFSAHGTAPRRRLNGDGISFKPRIVDVSGPGRVVRLPGGQGATIGPLEGLPEEVWLARRYGRSVYKILRLSPQTDLEALPGHIERALKERRSLVELELPVSPSR